MTPCYKSIFTEVPGTQIRVEIFCKYAKGHAGSHLAVATFNGIEFQVEYIEK